jgi:phosphotransferase system  glucose/maltose/N-acetylglucosamine-specific IIC component
MKLVTEPTVYTFILFLKKVFPTHIFRLKSYYFGDSELK